MGMVYGKGRKFYDTRNKDDYYKSQGFKEAKKRMESGPQEARGGSQADNGMDSHPGQGKAG